MIYSISFIKEVVIDEFNFIFTNVLFLLLSREVFGISPSEMRLYYVDHEMAELMGPEELKFNQKKLYTYSIQDGDEILIDRKY